MRAQAPSVHLWPAMQLWPQTPQLTESASSTVHLVPHITPGAGHPTIGAHAPCVHVCPAPLAPRGSLLKKRPLTRGVPAPSLTTYVTSAWSGRSSRWRRAARPAVHRDGAARIHHRAAPRNPRGIDIVVAVSAVLPRHDVSAH